MPQKTRTRRAVRRLGLAARPTAARLVAARVKRRFSSLHDLRTRSKLTSSTTNLLADAGALEGLRSNR
ncbi:MAG: hypothetical protein GY772_10760, partial [bacterium]|nr:hypothetical protein [bacterium]